MLKDMEDYFIVAGRKFKSRLILGTGKFASNAATKDAVEAGGCDIVTVALKRIDANPGAGCEDILDGVDANKCMILPNTSGAMNADEAVRIARLGRAAGLGDFIKLEIHPDPNYLLPDPIETLKATETLVKEGFKVMAYMNADGALAARLQDAGAAALMPLGAPIGSNMGIRNAEQIAIIIENARLPVVIDAGLGLPSHAAQAMEMGADAVMVNTAIATAADPARMAHAFKLAVEAGRAAFVAGGRWRGSWESLAASPTSPLTAFLEE